MGYFDVIFRNRGSRGTFGEKESVPRRAQEIADQVRDNIGAILGFHRVEAVNGYLNLFFSTSEYAHRVVDEVLTSGADLEKARRRTNVSWSNMRSPTLIILFILVTIEIPFSARCWPG